MALPALFYINGAIEGGLGLMEWLNPGTTINKPNKLGNDALFYARVFGPMCFSFGIMSIYMAKQHDSKAKQIFSASWLLYHSSVVWRRGKQVLNGQSESNIIVPFIIHTSLAIGFVYYLKQVGFTHKTLLFQ